MACESSHIFPFADFTHLYTGHSQLFCAIYCFKKIRGMCGKSRMKARRGDRKMLLTIISFFFFGASRRNRGFSYPNMWKKFSRFGHPSFFPLYFLVDNLSRPKKIPKRCITWGTSFSSTLGRNWHPTLSNAPAVPFFLELHPQGRGVDKEGLERGGSVE